MKKLVTMAALFTVLCGTAYADSIGVRGAVAETKASEDFDAYEFFVVLDLPWAWQTEAARIQSQLEVTGGVLEAAGETGLLGALGPRLAYVRDRVSVDVSIGVAALGETEFGSHDFAGRSQFVAQAGIAFALTERFNAGVRFRHMSDADIHDHGEGLNLFLLELSYDYLVR